MRLNLATCVAVVAILIDVEATRPHRGENVAVRVLGNTTCGADSQESTCQSPTTTMITSTTTTGAVPESPLSTYVPPPNTAVTPALIQQALNYTAQQNVTVHSIIPQFAQGVITFILQFEGAFADTIAVNATDSLPCGAIGSNNSTPNLILIPQSVQNGSPQVTISDCLVIAVNKDTDPHWIKYWVQRPDGSIFALLGDNHVHFLDQMVYQVPALLSIRVAPPNFAVGQKRDLSAAMGSYDAVVSASRTQVASPHAVVMTEQACRAMVCLKSNVPPLFNPFTNTCWCVAPFYAVANPSALDLG